MTKKPMVEPFFGPVPPNKPIQPHPYPGPEHINPAKPEIARPAVKPIIQKPVLPKKP